MKEKDCQSRIIYSAELFFRNDRLIYFQINKDWEDSSPVGMHCKKIGSPSRWKEKTSCGNLDPIKEIKSKCKGNYINKYKDSIKYIILFFY